MRVHGTCPDRGCGKAPMMESAGPCGIQARRPLAAAIAVVTSRMLVWSRLPRQQARWTGMWWSARLAAIRRMLIADPARVESGDGLVPVDVGVGLSAGVGAGGDVVVGEAGVGEPSLVGADQLVGGARGGQPAGVGDQRVREVVGVG